MLDTGCAQSAARMQTGMVVAVSINVSGRQLTDATIAMDVAAALDRSGAGPSHISQDADGALPCGMMQGVAKLSISILEGPVYGVVEAAGLLGLRPDRTRAWLDGYIRGATTYPPVIRTRSTGDDVVTWGEFVELGYLREYRHTGVPLQRLRPVIDALRQEYATPYPLATAKPYVYGQELVLTLQERNDIPRSIAVVIRSGQTLMLSDGAQRFFKKVEFEPASEAAVRLHPAGPTSPVVIDPLVSFGRPSVQGIATERLWELVDAGDPVEEIAEAYEVPAEVVRAAAAYEEQLRSLAA